MIGDQVSKLLGQLAQSFRFTSFALRRTLLAIFLLISLTLFLKITFFSSLRAGEVPVVSNTPWHSKTLVVSSMKKDDTRWIEENLADWVIHRYVTDDARASHTVPKNKGREAMVYLTYIIDNYNALPELMVFIHGERYQWHNDDPVYDGVYMLSNLQVPFLLENGYTNIRCVWTLGCPAELDNLNKPPAIANAKDETSASNTQIHFPSAFHALFPGKPLPPTVGVACCAQFAVTKNKIHERPLQDYIHYRNWLLETNLPDHVSGRVLEYGWHIIFGQEAVHCPNARECYCKVFGYCDLICDGNGERTCGRRWPFPPFATLPKGWPLVGWYDVSRTKEEVEALRWVGFQNRTGLQTVTTTPG